MQSRWKKENSIIEQKSNWLASELKVILIAVLEFFSFLFFFCLYCLIFVIEIMSKSLEDIDLPMMNFKE